MMKASELRLGNWVQFKVKDKYYQAKVDGVYSKGPLVLTGEESYSGFEPSDCEPIPITEEWLFKFGAKEYRKGDKSAIYFPFDKKNGIYFLMNEYKQCFILQHGQCGNGMDVKYVHQLQNLYFALTGEELTLKQLK